MKLETNISDLTVTIRRHHYEIFQILSDGVYSSKATCTKSLFPYKETTPQDLINYVKRK